MLRSPRAVIAGSRYAPRFPIPMRIGPTSSPFPFIFRMLRAAPAASVEAKTSAFAAP
jgi:hypothetical protein